MFSKSLHFLSRILPDRIYLNVVYHHHFGRNINFKSPKTYNEKLQWLKLYDRNPRYVELVDKHTVKDYVKKIIGEKYVIPTLGIWNNVEDIDFSKLPDSFVLKCTHDSGGIVVCKEKTSFDINQAKKILKKHLRINYFYGGREWPYKGIKPKIIAEPYIIDAETNELRDYKLFTFDGATKALFIASDRLTEGEETKFDFFDEHGCHLDIKNGHPNAHPTPLLPKKLDLMKELATKLAKGIPHVRVDFYEANDKVYFGEMTFYHFSGFVPFQPEQWDYKFGSWIKLPAKKSNCTRKKNRNEASHD